MFWLDLSDVGTWALSQACATYSLEVARDTDVLSNQVLYFYLFKKQTNKVHGVLIHLLPEQLYCYSPPFILSVSMKLFQYKDSLYVTKRMCILIDCDLSTWRGWCTVLNMLKSVAELGMHTAPCLLLVSSTYADVLVPSSVAFCCGAWLQVLLMGRSFSIIELSGLSSWSMKLSLIVLFKTWKTRLQRLQIPSLKKVRKKLFTNRIK